MTVRERFEWPDGKDFAFTIFDDTDLATLDALTPVHAFLDVLGLRTTKSVWPIRGIGMPPVPGLTSDDPEYLAWTLDLQTWLRDRLSRCDERDGGTGRRGRGH